MSEKKQQVVITSKGSIGSNIGIAVCIPRGRLQCGLTKEKKLARNLEK